MFGPSHYEYAKKNKVFIFTSAQNEVIVILSITKEGVVLLVKVITVVSQVLLFAN